MRKHGLVRLSALLLILLLTLSACMPSGTRNTDSPDTAEVEALEDFVYLFCMKEDRVALPQSAFSAFDGQQPL